MTEEEIEIVAAELAKAGGTAWYPGRERGSLLRLVTNRYRERARIAIAALDRFRTGEPATVPEEEQKAEGSSHPDHRIRPGDIVVYRPPGDKRAYSCRVLEIEGDRAYLVPELASCTGWFPIQDLMASPNAFALNEDSTPPQSSLRKHK